MKILQAMKLGHKLTMIHKKSSAVFTIFFGLLFSSVVVFALMISREQNVIMDEYKNVTDGKVLMKISMCDGSYVDGACKQPEVYDATVKQEVKKYHGENIGAVITYISKDDNEMISVIPDKAVKNLNVEPAYYAPDDMIPVVTSKNFNAKIENGFYNLGKFPEGENKIYLVLDSTSKVLNYILLNDFVVYSYEPLVIFDKFEDAKDFAKNKTEAFEIFTGMVEKTHYYNANFNIIKFLFMSYFIIALVIIIMMLIILFRKDEKLVSLYRSLGATKKNIATIYFMSIFEMTIYIAIIATAIGNLIGLMIH